MGERVLVVGAGCVGQTTAQIANAMGTRVTLCDIDEKRLEVASQIAPLIRDVVPVNEAKRIYGTLRDSPNNLLGTVFVW